MRLFAVEGNTQQLDGGAMYGNAPRALWSRWSPPDELNRIRLASRALLVDAGNQKVLFEAGVGAAFDPAQKERYGIAESGHVLLASLSNIGLSDSDIDAVVLSHLHFDHAGGLLTPYDGRPPRLLFPKARFYVGRTHWERARNPHLRDRASFLKELCPLLEASGRLVLVDESGPFPLPNLSFRLSHGHTPGLVVSVLELADGPLAFVADLAPGAPWVHLPITMGYDRSPELLVEEKSALFGELIARSGALFFTHDPDLAAGRLVFDSAKQRYGVLPLTNGCKEIL